MNNDTLEWDIFDEKFCLWDWNISTGIISLSKNLIDVLGFDANEYFYSTKWFNSLIHPEDLTLVLWQLEAQLTGEQQNQHFSFRLKNADNQYVNFCNKGIVVLRVEGEEPTHVMWAYEKVSGNVLS